MNPLQFLQDNSKSIITEATELVTSLQLKGYTRVGKERTRQKLEELLKKIMSCIKKRSLIPVITYTDKIARERYNSGYNLYEVQSAINSLELVIWNKIFKQVPPGNLAQILGTISTVIGAGKDNLARMYVALAANTKKPTLNLSSLFEGSESIVNL
ncbi:MAG: hypothetical protein ACP5P3_06900 [Ignavibacteria bacterium]